jgi:hypothetical protein
MIEELIDAERRKRSFNLKVLFEYKYSKICSCYISLNDKNVQYTSSNEEKAFNGALECLDRLTLILNDIDKEDIIFVDYSKYNGRYSVVKISLDRVRKTVIEPSLLDEILTINLTYKFEMNKFWFVDVSWGGKNGYTFLYEPIPLLDVDGKKTLVSTNDNGIEIWEWDDMGPLCGDCGIMMVDKNKMVIGRKLTAMS